MGTEVMGFKYRHYGQGKSKAIRLRHGVGAAWQWEDTDTRTFTSSEDSKPLMVVRREFVGYAEQLAQNANSLSRHLVHVSMCQLP